VARRFGADTAAMWKRADSVIEDLFAASRMSPREIARLLREYIKVRLQSKDHLPFEEARTSIYEQIFYPIVTHFTFALQPSAVARLKFVRKAVQTIAVEDAVVADVGCGSGMILCEVLTMKPSWKGYGLDISCAAVNYAGRLAEHKKVAGRTEFRTGDIGALPFASNSLDLLIASEVIEHLPDPASIIKELARVLKSGGKLLLTMPVESHTPAHMHSLGSAEELKLLCEEAGLNILTLESKWHFGYGDDRKHIFALLERK
jgi:2-polyprenyl-3-methyl-5-hydroxy-6-metoxy-1,4-benzoquinol methylase